MSISLNDTQKKFIQTLADLSYGTSKGEHEQGGKGNIGVFRREDGTLVAMKYNTHRSAAADAQKRVNAGGEQEMVTASQRLRQELTTLCVSLKLDKGVISAIVGDVSDRTLLTRKAVATVIRLLEKKCTGLKDVWADAAKNAVRSQSNMDLAAVAKTAKYRKELRDLTQDMVSSLRQSQKMLFEIGVSGASEFLEGIDLPEDGGDGIRAMTPETLSACLEKARLLADYGIQDFRSRNEIENFVVDAVAKAGGLDDKAQILRLSALCMDEVLRKISLDEGGERQPLADTILSWAQYKIDNRNGFAVDFAGDFMNDAVRRKNLDLTSSKYTIGESVILLRHGVMDAFAQEGRTVETDPENARHGRGDASQMARTGMDIGGPEMDDGGASHVEERQDVFAPAVDSCMRMTEDEGRTVFENLDFITQLDICRRWNKETFSSFELEEKWVIDKCRDVDGRLRKRCGGRPIIEPFPTTKEAGNAFLARLDVALRFPSIYACAKDADRMSDLMTVLKTTGSVDEFLTALQEFEASLPSLDVDKVRDVLKQ